MGPEALDQGNTALTSKMLEPMLENVKEGGQDDHVLQGNNSISGLESTTFYF